LTGGISDLNSLWEGRRSKRPQLEQRLFRATVQDGLAGIDGDLGGLAGLLFVGRQKNIVAPLKP
jgi:hypothetical protein